MKFPDALIMRMRMYPYKTKLPCDDQVDWGYTPVKADYPTRDLKPIAIFDIKEFVKNKKQEQMMNQVNSAPINFNGFNPNGMMPPYVGGPMSQAPINPRMDFDSMNLSNEDLDKMIADIDKRIAELDAEEALEKAKAQEKDISIPNKEEKPEVKVPNLDDILAKISAEAEEEKQKQKEDKNFVLPSLDAEEVLEDMPVVSEKKKDLPKINIDADSIVSNNNVISDDEFFDDFFADDDE